MPMPTWGLVTIVVARPGKRVSRGTEVADWSNPTKAPVGGCWVGNPQTSTDKTQTAMPATSRATLYLPPGADVRKGDKVTYAGRDYAVDGEPMAYPSPLGGVDHIEVPLVDWSANG